MGARFGSRSFPPVRGVDGGDVEAGNESRSETVTCVDAVAAIAAALVDGRGRVCRLFSELRPCALRTTARPSDRTAAAAKTRLRGSVVTAARETSLETAPSLA